MTVSLFLIKENSVWLIDVKIMNTDEMFDIRKNNYLYKKYIFICFFKNIYIMDNNEDK